VAVYYYYANLASDLRFRERGFLRSMGHPSSTKLSSAIKWVGEEQQVPFRRARAGSLKLGFEAQQRFSQIRVSQKQLDSFVEHLEYFRH
jgi:hypothetical protein